MLSTNYEMDSELNLENHKALAPFLINFKMHRLFAFPEP